MTPLQDLDLILKRVRRLLASGNVEQAAALISALRPAEAADVVSALHPADAHATIPQAPEGSKRRGFV